MADDASRVPARLYWKTRLGVMLTPLQRRLGDLESRLLADDIAQVPIEGPIYVTGLARAGTTIVTELIAAHPSVTSHRYADFPFLHTPYWRNWLHQRTRVAAPQPVERAHGDRIEVTIDSPEALEEPLWMLHFRDQHDESIDQVLDARTSNPAFEQYYRDHIRKLLLVRGRSRYLAKGNYNISRLGYLRRLFGDARFIIMVRRPEWHIASLAKQHRRFMQAGRDNPRVRTQLAATGHFEFGPDRIAINVGDDAALAQVRRCWAEGREVEGWARYWAMLYGWLADQLQGDDSLSRSCIVVRYEDLCDHPASTIERILNHCALDQDQYGEIGRSFASRLSPPGYYQPDFADDERDVIRQTCAATAARYGYDSPLIACAAGSKPSHSYHENAK